MTLHDDPVYTRAAKRQSYEDFRKYAKAPPFRRALAALIDFALFGAPAVFGFFWTGSYLVAIPFILYLLFRDSLMCGRSMGKAITGLIVVHYETFAPCTVKQSLIRNCLYASVCPILLLIGVAAMGVGAILLSLALIVLAFTRTGFSPLFFIGYDPDTGRTIPDSWAGTHVLTPNEISTILRLRDGIHQRP